MIEILQVIVGLVLLAVMGYNLYNQWEMKKLVDGMGLRIRTIEAEVCELMNNTEVTIMPLPDEVPICDDESCSRNDGRTRRVAL